MITAKRRISTDQERFGGYVCEPRVITDEPEKELSFKNDRLNISKRDFGIAEETAKTEKQDYVSINTQAPEAQTVKYSQLEYYTDSYVPKYDITAPVQSAKREAGDVMPTIRRKSENVQADARRKSALTTKTKAVIAAYVAVVAMLAIAVIGIGIAVSGINAEAAEISSEIQVKSERLAELNSQIGEYSDFESIADKAAANGMKKINSATEVELIPVSETVTYEGRTNWFDKFCDFISKIIGG